MSIATLTATPDGFDEFLRFAAVVERFDRDELGSPDPGLPRREHRPARMSARRAAITASLRDDLPLGIHRRN